MSVVQLNSDIRNMVMPGARMQMIVVMKLTAPRMVPKPASAEAEDPQVRAEVGRVRQAGQRRVGVQPKLAAPCGVRKPTEAIRPPNRYSQ